MKQIIIIVGTIVIIFIAAMTIVSVESKDLRTDELNRAVSASIKKTVSDSQIENQSTILSDKEMVAYFIQLLSVNMKGKGDVTVEVYDADYKEGLLSVAVTEKFKYVNGKNVTYLKHNFNKNGSAARNTGWKHSSGKYITFLDDDDEIDESKIQKQVECLEKLDESWGACYTAYKLIKEYGSNQISTENRSGDCYV